MPLQQGALSHNFLHLADGFTSAVTRAAHKNMYKHSPPPSTDSVEAYHYQQQRWEMMRLTTVHVYVRVSLVYKFAPRAA